MEESTKVDAEFEIRNQVNEMCKELTLYKQIAEQQNKAIQHFMDKPSIKSTRKVDIWYDERNKILSDLDKLKNQVK